MPQLRRHLLIGACSLTIAATGALTVASAALATGTALTEVRQSTPPAHAPATSEVPTPQTALNPARRAPRTPRRAPTQARVRKASNDPYGRFGFDISWPQCHGVKAVLPPALGPVAIVGITDGRPFSTNPCLRAEWSWARSRSSASGYINLAAPRSGDPLAFGAATARDALLRAHATGVVLRSLWLDVEIGNHWSSDFRANAQVVTGAVRELQTQGISAGVYSTDLDWRQITHGAALTVPVWMAVRDGRKILQGCATVGFGGRAPDLVQAVFRASDGHLVDGDLICSSRRDFLRMLR